MHTPKNIKEIKFFKKFSFGLLAIAAVMILTLHSNPVSSAVGPVINTPWDEIPDFGFGPTIVSARSGPWSNPLTWFPNRLPAAGDIVNIMNGHTVTYDIVSSIPIKTVSVLSGGQLSFRTDINTKLTVVHLLIRDGATLKIGDALNPVNPSDKAEIVIANNLIDVAQDPRKYGNGLIALGKVTMHGAPKTSWLRLATEPMAGNSTLNLAAAINGWRPDDSLVIPDTREVDFVTLKGGADVWQGDTLSVASVSGDGRTITLPSSSPI